MRTLEDTIKSLTMRDMIEENVINYNELIEFLIELKARRDITNAEITETNLGASMQYLRKAYGVSHP